MTRYSISVRLPSWISASFPKTTRLMSCVLNPRLFLILALTLFLCLVMVSVWSHQSSLEHQHYATDINTRKTSADQDLTYHNFGIVIDAGSSSSKIHLFHWPPHNGDPHQLLSIRPLTDEFGDPLSKKVEPGISTFSSTPEAAFNSLVPLLAFACANIPPDKQSQTILFILGTAGMRMLTEMDQDKIISHLYLILPVEYPFHVPKQGIQVISGKLEGVFGWITVNYLLNNFSPDSHTHIKSKMITAIDKTLPPNQLNSESVHTAGIIDMGGASLQIAFEVPQQVDVSGLADNVVEINIGCGINDNEHRHRVFTKTYLGYGSNEARSRYYRRLLEEHIRDSSHNHSLSSGLAHPPLIDPCTQLNRIENVTIGNKFSLRVKGSGDFNACKNALQALVDPPENKTGVTESENLTQLPLPDPCVYSTDKCNKVIQFERPPFSLQYTTMDYYGTSEFWYTMRDVLRIGGTYSAKEFEKKSHGYCQTDWKLVHERYTKRLYTYADLFRLQSQCFKSSWLSVALHKGLELPPDSISLKTASSLSGQSVQWPLGALLYYTRYLPLREVQLQQLQQSVKSSRWSHKWLTHSSFHLPLLVVLLVIFLLIFCRHGRHRSSSNFKFQRSYSVASALNIQRRNSVVSASSLSSSQDNHLNTRNQSSIKLSGLV